MANRAYLFCSDCDPDDPSAWTNLAHNDQPYYDSRHGIPLSWFCFFKPTEVNINESVLTEGYKEGAVHWYGPTFMANKQQALEGFRHNEARLAQIVGPALYTEAYRRFLPTLSEMRGCCLCMDPTEIAEEGELDLIRFRRILELFNDKDAPVEAIKEAVTNFSRTVYKNQDNLDLDVIGVTYW